VRDTRGTYVACRNSFDEFRDNGDNDIEIEDTAVGLREISIGAVEYHAGN